jgi:hypothetical protein
MVVVEGSLIREVPGRVASGPDKAGTFQHRQMGRVRRTRRTGVRKEPACYASLVDTGSNLTDLGRVRYVSISSFGWGTFRRVFVRPLGRPR